MKAQALHPSHNKALTLAEKTGVFQQFLNWTDRMDYFRVIILAGMIMCQTCITAPIALYTMNLAYGFNDVQIYVVIVGLFSVLVTNLAVQPMRVTIPTFMLASLGQIAITIINLIVLF